MIYSNVIEKRDKHFQQIKTDNLIALCELDKDYKLFCDDLEKLIKSKNSKNLVAKVYNTIQGKQFLGSRKYKDFIEKHKATIDIMTKYSCLNSLITSCYDEKGNREADLDEDYFYHYLQKNKKDIETIKAVALKIKSLGIDTINFKENFDFTKLEYKLDSSYGSDFAFLENMAVIPSYLNSPIKYKTNDSCYCLILGTNGSGNNKEISKFYRNIELNSLIFNPDRLPNEITIESTMELIYQLAENKIPEHNDIRYSVDLNISINDLKNYFERLKIVIQNIERVKNNQELVSLLSKMQDILIKLQLFEEDFENQITSAYTDITPETMEKEKRLYLNRRYLESIDLD